MDKKRPKKRSKRDDQPPISVPWITGAKIFKKNFSNLGKTRFLVGRKKRVALKLLFGQFILLVLLASTAAGENNNTYDQEINSVGINRSAIYQTITTQILPFETQKPLEVASLTQDFSNYHPAVDLATDFGSEILPIAQGVVEEVGYDPYGKGKIIVLDHGSDIKSLYAHLGKTEVEKGEEVQENTVIGEVGLSGKSTGAHLHLEIYEEGETVDPKNLLPKEEFSIKP